MAIFRIKRPGDITLNRNSSGKLELSLVYDVDYVKQKLAHRLKFVLGEFFADVRQGLPYFERVLVSNPDLQLIRALFYNAIQTSPGILSVQSFETLFDKRNRALGVSFTATTSGGQLLSVDSRVNQDFIIQIDALNFV